MTAPFVITTATEQVDLDQNRSGEATFTVTNQGAKVARGTFDIRPGDNADAAWFTVEEPQRTLRPGASVAVLVKVHPGPTAVPGAYEFEARMTSSEGAPEENFVLSRRVLMEVPAPPAATKRKFPWWIVIAAALLALVVGVVTWLAWPSAEPTVTPTPSSSPTPAPSAEPVVYIAVPRVEGQNIEAARKLLTDAGLKIGNLSYRFGGNNTVARQYVQAGHRVAKGTAIDLEVVIQVTRPVISSPGNNASIAKGQWPAVVWTTSEPYSNRWLTVMQLETCTRVLAGGPEPCTYVTVEQPIVVTEKTFRFAEPKWDFTVKPTGSRHTGWVQVQVIHIDTMGALFESSVVKFFMEH